MEKKKNRAFILTNCFKRLVLLFTVKYIQNNNMMSLLTNHKTNKLTGSVLEDGREEGKRPMFCGGLKGGWN